ncbi:MAG: A/G-specific adenine glycosylase [Burkholderiales bacterium]|nr:A/G-specific adenine glycosylase [Burkholderiales bacterium]
MIAWQRESGRSHLPWQATRDPYRVWLSEVMLQQTQVTTVLGYYERFLARFPDVSALGVAALDEVLALWSGLGYYSRARNMHLCAQAVIARHGGTFPCSAAQLETLPGIGRSTAAAIASFCFGERVAILDGNVKRVLGRVLAFGDDLASSAAERKLWTQAQALLPEDSADMPAYTQGLMDLGATLCLQRAPACPRCPLSQVCRALAEGAPLAYPVKTRKTKRSQRENWWLWLKAGDAVWLEQRPTPGVWAGLWTLPLFDDSQSLLAAVDQLPNDSESPAFSGESTRLLVAESDPARRSAPELEPLADVKHVLTHFDWLLHPRRLRLPDSAVAAPAPGGRIGRWVRRADLVDVGLPAPLRKLLDTSAG